MFLEKRADRRAVINVWITIFTLLLDTALLYRNPGQAGSRLPAFFKALLVGDLCWLPAADVGQVIRACRKETCLPNIPFTFRHARTQHLYRALGGFTCLLEPKITCTGESFSNNIWRVKKETVFLHSLLTYIDFSVACFATRTSEGRYFLAILILSN